MITIDVSECIAARDLKIGRCRQLLNVSFKVQGNENSIIIMMLM